MHILTLYLLFLEDMFDLKENKDLLGLLEPKYFRQNYKVKIVMVVTYISKHLIMEQLQLL